MTGHSGVKENLKTPPKKCQHRASKWVAIVTGRTLNPSLPQTLHRLSAREGFALAVSRYFALAFSSFPDTEAITSIGHLWPRSRRFLYYHSVCLVGADTTHHYSPREHVMLWLDLKSPPSPYSLIIVFDSPRSALVTCQLLPKEMFLHN